MKFEIKNRWNGKIIFSIETDSFELAVEAAIKAKTNLSAADLRDANLSAANLSAADLRDANLSAANLSNANLSDANLRDAKGFNKFITTSLYFLCEQVGIIRAYKLVNSNFEGPQYGGIIYKIGNDFSVEQVDDNEYNQCGAGISLATLDWCLKNYVKGYHVLVAEFFASDIVAIPIGSDGKFRVKRCKIVSEKKLEEIGLTEK